MSRLRREGETEPVDLRVQHLIGRSSSCHLRLDQPEASALHAMLQWSEEGWELHDLGSRNGTWLDGRRLAPGERATLTAGARLGFGALEPGWRLISDAAPPARAFPADGGPPVEERAGTLALPATAEPEVLVFRDELGVWWIESDLESMPAPRRVQAGGLSWELDLPELDPRTPLAALPAVGVPELSLRFQVSSDEEHVSLTAVVQGVERPMGARAHHYLLLTLARLRLQDAADRPDEAGGHGWTQVEDLMRMFRVEETQLNLQIFRIRRQFTAAGFSAPQQIIERRRGTGQVRIGVSALMIQRG